MKEIEYELIGEGTDDDPERPDAFDDPEIEGPFHWDRVEEKLYQIVTD